MNKIFNSNKKCLFIRGLKAYIYFIEMEFACTHDENRLKVMKILDIIPEKNKEQVVSSILKQKTNETSNASTNKNTELIMSTPGSKVRVILNPKIKKKFYLQKSHSIITKIILDYQVMK